MHTHRILASLVLGAIASSTFAVPPGVVYHLRAGSTVQEGCFGTCMCDITNSEPLRGLFILRLAAPDPTTHINYNIENIQWRSPSLGLSFIGTGTYEVESATPGFELLSLDIATPGNNPVHGLAGRRVYAATPIIDTAVSLDLSTCAQLNISILATPFRSDWNADGAIDTNDIFAYINAWFAGDGDSDDDGHTTTADIFGFLNSWLARE